MMAIMFTIISVCLMAKGTKPEDSSILLLVQIQMIVTPPCYRLVFTLSSTLVQDQLYILFSLDKNVSGFLDFHSSELS